MKICSFSVLGYITMKILYSSQKFCYFLNVKALKSPTRQEMSEVLFYHCTGTPTVMAKNIGTPAHLSDYTLSQKIIAITNVLVFTCVFLLIALEQHKNREKVKSDKIPHTTQKMD